MLSCGLVVFNDVSEIYYLFHVEVVIFVFFFFFQAEDGIRDVAVTGVQTCALPILCLGLRIPTRIRRPRFTLQRNETAMLNTRDWLRAGALATLASICELALHMPKQSGGTPRPRSRTPSAPPARDRPCHRLGSFVKKRI